MRGPRVPRQRTRTVSRRQAHAAAQELMAARLRGTGWSLERLVEMRLGDVLPSPELDEVLRHRRGLDLPAGDDAPLLVDDAGRRLTRHDLPSSLLLVAPKRHSGARDAPE